MLLEFARRNLRRQGCWLPGAWVHAPLVACVILAALVGGISVANALSRYGLGFVGAVGTGVVFALIARQLSGREQRLAFLAAVGWVLYGIAAGLIVPAAPFWPASELNQRWFLETTGLPIQLIRGLIACSIAIAIWGIWGQKRISTVSSVRYTGFVHRQFFATAAAMLVILLCGWGLTEYLGIVHKDQLREESQGKLDLLATSLGGETAPADAVVRLFAGSPTVRAFMSSTSEPAGLRRYLREGHPRLSHCKLRRAARLPVRQKRRPGHVGRAAARVRQTGQRQALDCACAITYRARRASF